MEISIYDSISELDMREWDEIVGPDRLFQSSGWLRALEGGALADCTPKYFVVRDASGGMIANASAYIIPTSLLLFSKGILRSAVDNIRRIWPSFLMPRILECGCPLGPGNGISLRKGVTLAQIAEPLANAFDQVADQEKIRLLVVRDFLESTLSDAEVFEAFGYACASNLSTMTLNIEWDTIASYMSALRSRHRKKVRRGLLLAERSLLHAEVSTDVARHAKRLARQRMNVHDFAVEYSRETLSASFYEQLVAELGERVRVVEIKRGTESVAHALIVDDGALLRWLSFGREVGGTRDGAYFLAIATIVRIAIEEKKSLIDMGMTTHGPKTDYGAEMEEQWLLLKVRGFLGSLITRLLIQFNPVAQATDRKVFRGLEPDLRHLG